MTTLPLHPLLYPMQNSKSVILSDRAKKKKLHKILIAQSINNGLSGNLFEDIFGGAFDFVAGLQEAMGNILESVVQAIGALIQAVINIIGGVLSLIAWDRIFDNLGIFVRGYFNLVDQLNPARLWVSFLSTNEITSHTFSELDKFTGGMITSAANVSTLMARAGRGDAITKEELLKDAIFILQVASVIIGGPAAAGGLVGSMVGREACKNAGDGKEACQIAVTIVAAASANYAADYYGAAWGPSGASTVDPSSQSGSVASDTLVTTQRNNLNNLFIEGGVRDFSNYLTEGATQVLTQRGVQEATREAVSLCQSGGWAGDKECAILGQIASNYINAPVGVDWPTFLAQEAGRIGVSVLLEEWFPDGSPERRALQYQINYVDIPGQTIIVESKKKSNLGVLALVASGAAALFLMGS